MAASSKLITEGALSEPDQAPVSPTDGLGRRPTEMQAWPDQNCGANGWAVTPAGLRGVGNDAVQLYFLDTPSLWQQGRAKPRAYPSTNASPADHTNPVARRGQYNSAL
jgi:hypothetical protein